MPELSGFEQYFSVITVHEFIGTAILVLIGTGTVATQTLTWSHGHGADWVLTSLGWGLAVFVGASVAWHSGAHLNPAVTLGLALIGSISWAMVPFYLAGEFLGAMAGAGIIYLAYKKLFDTTESPETTGGIFYTSPAPKTRSLGWNTVSEAVATFVLVYWIMQQSPWVPATTTESPNYGNLGLGYAGVAFAVIAIGAGLGGSTGYAINPARDFGPRLVYKFLPIKNKQKIDWAYAWVPIVGPLLGAVAAAGVYLAASPFE